MSDNFERDLKEIKRLVDTDYTTQSDPSRQAPRLEQKPQQKGKKEGAAHRKISSKKPKKIGKWVIWVGAITVVAAIALFLLCGRSDSGAKNAPGKLAGAWYYDQYTQYEFDGNGNGCLCLDGNSHFKFTYRDENGVLYLDFLQDYVTDCQYTYTLDGDKLTLVGGEGTAEVGKVYNLSKIG